MRRCSRGSMRSSPLAACDNMRRALDLMAHLAGLAPDHDLAAEPLPDAWRASSRCGRRCRDARLRSSCSTAPICSPPILRRSRRWRERSTKKASMFERFTSPASRIATPATSSPRLCVTGAARRRSTPQPSQRASTMRRRRSKPRTPQSCRSCSQGRAAKPGRTRRAAFRNRITPCRWCCPSSTGGLLTTAISFKADGERGRRPRIFPRRASDGAGRHRRRCAQRVAVVASRHHAARASASLRSCCRTIPEQQGKPPTPSVSTPSPARPRSCSSSRAKGSMSAIRFPTIRASSPSFAAPSLRRSSRSPTTSACSRPSTPTPAPGSSRLGAHLTTTLLSMPVTSPCALRATAG